jgi:hypothetical protein
MVNPLISHGRKCERIIFSYDKCIRSLVNRTLRRELCKPANCVIDHTTFLSTARYYFTRNANSLETSLVKRPLVFF